MKHVVVIGGGYAGVFALKELVKQQNIKITLIDKHTFHNLQPEVYDFIANESNLADVTIDLSSLCNGFDHPYLEFKNLRVTNIDFDTQVIFSQENETVKYDYLLLAIGSRTFFPKQVKGLNHTNDIKKLHKALYFKQHFEKQLFRKVADETKKCDQTHIVVVGAGLSGVEIAAEMAHFAKKFFKRGSFVCDYMKISLISSGTTILPGFDEKMIELSHKRLKDLQIDIITETKMTSCDDDYVHLSNNTKIRYSFVVFAGGVEGANLINSIDLITNEKSQILVNQYLQAEGKSNIFAAGDIAQIKNKHGVIMPANVTIARLSGTKAAKNIIKHIQGDEFIKCEPYVEGTLIALGGRYAVCDLYGVIKVKGFLGYLIKQFVFFKYRFPLIKYIKKGYKKIKNPI